MINGRILGLNRLTSTDQHMTLMVGPWRWLVWEVCCLLNKVVFRNLHPDWVWAAADEVIIQEPSSRNSAYPLSGAKRRE